MLQNTNIMILNRKLFSQKYLFITKERKTHSHSNLQDDSNHNLLVRDEACYQQTTLHRLILILKYN